MHRWFSALLLAALVALRVFVRVSGDMIAIYMLSTVSFAGLVFVFLIWRRVMFLRAFAAALFLSGWVVLFLVAVGNPFVWTTVFASLLSGFSTTVMFALCMLMGYNAIDCARPIGLPPFFSLSKALRFLFPTKDFEEVIWQCVNDQRIEYYEAVKANQSIKACYVIGRGYLAIFLCIAALTMRKITKPLSELLLKVAGL